MLSGGHRFKTPSQAEKLALHSEAATVKSLGALGWASDPLIAVPPPHISDLLTRIPLRYVKWLPFSPRHSGVKRSSSRWSPEEQLPPSSEATCAEAGCFLRDKTNLISDVQIKWEQTAQTGTVTVL